MMMYFDAVRGNQTRSMVMNNRTVNSSLRLCATLLLAGQLLYIVVTQFHADGPANNHPVVFAEYARSRKLDRGTRRPVRGHGDPACWAARSAPRA